MTDKERIRDLQRHAKMLEKRLRAIERVGVDHWLPRLRQRIDTIEERVERLGKRSNG